MKSPPKLLAVLAIGALALSACGDDKPTVRTSSSSTAPTTTSVAPSTTTAPLTTVPQTIVVPPPPSPAPSTSAVTLPPITVPDLPPPTVPPTTAPPPPTTDPPTTSTDEPTTTTKPRKPSRRTVVYTAADAPKRKATLVVPRSDHLDTLIVLVHGGNGSNGGRNQLREWQDYYAEHDVPSLSIDYFLFKASTPPPVYPQPEADVTAAVQWATQNAADLDIDPDRIVVQGFTAGAALGAQALIADAEAPAAFVGLEGRYDGEQSDPEQYYGGPPDSEDPDVQERYAQADSISLAADANGPSLLFAASGGPAELVEQAQAFDDALEAIGSDLVLVPGTGGAFDTGGKELTPDGEAAAERILTWLTANFPPTS